MLKFLKKLSKNFNFSFLGDLRDINHLSFWVIISTIGIVSYLTIAFLYYQLMKICPNIYILKLLVWIIFWSLVIIFPLFYFLSKFYYNKLIKYSLIFSAIWLGFLFYFGLALLFFKIVSIFMFFIFQKNINYIFPAFIFSSLITIYGVINNRNYIKISYITYHTSKIKQSLKIGFISDIHLSSLTSDSKIEKTIKILNSHNLDLILIGGDLIDSSIIPVEKRNLIEKLETLNSKNGIYMTTGNHEFIWHIEKIRKRLKNSKITLIEDENVLFEELNLAIIFRKDKAAKRKKETRLHIKEIIKNVPNSFLKILVEHQPVEVFEEVKYIDIALYGHTHNGQMWPLHILVSLFFPIKYGEYKIDNKLIYVSEGLDTWGPPLRVGASPEIVILEILPIY